MWMVDPKILCKKHLTGEHVEMHMFVGSINKGKSIAGHAILNQAEPQKLRQRHNDLADEMLSRGYKHESPLVEFSLARLPRATLLAKVNKRQALLDLLNRCSECKKRHEALSEKN